MNGEAYELKESTRAKHLRISVHADGRVVVTKPVRMRMQSVEAFIAARAAWIASARTRFQKRQKGHALEILPKPRKGTKEYKAAIAQARVLVQERLKHFSSVYGFTYGTVSIRNQTTRWGSCSAKNNLSFNYRIVYLPPQLRDYIVVHELCHTRQHNHSPRFWREVALILPDHEVLKKEIRLRYRL